MRLALPEVLELGDIQVRTTYLFNQAYSNCPTSLFQIASLYQGELETHKVTLENYLLEMH